MLSGSVSFEIRSERNAELDTGRLILLPHLEGVDNRQAVNLALEDMLGLPQEVLAPEWAETIDMPGLNDLRAEIEQNEKEIGELVKRVESKQAEIADIEVFKKLLYATGQELE